MKKPTYREIDNKIRLAREAIAEGYIAIVSPDVIAADALELEYEIGELRDILGDLLARITPDDYAGTSPPQQSYEEAILKCDLFAFSVASSCFDCDVYLKFALKGDTFWLVSLHKARDKKDR